MLVTLFWRPVSLDGMQDEQGMGKVPCRTGATFSMLLQGGNIYRKALEVTPRPSLERALLVRHKV